MQNIHLTTSNVSHGTIVYLIIVNVDQDCKYYLAGNTNQHWEK